MIKMVSTSTVSEFEWNRWMNVTSSIAFFFAFNLNNGLKWWQIILLLLLLLPHLHTNIEFTNRLFLALPRIFYFFFRCATCFALIIYFCKIWHKIKVKNTTKELQTVQKCSLDLRLFNYARQDFHEKICKDEHSIVFIHFGCIHFPKLKNRYSFSALLGISVIRLELDLNTVHLIVDDWRAYIQH